MKNLTFFCIFILWISISPYAYGENDTDKIVPYSDTNLIGGWGILAGINNKIKLDIPPPYIELGLQYKNFSVKTHLLFALVISTVQINASYRFYKLTDKYIDIFVSGGSNAGNYWKDIIYSIGTNLGYKNFYIPIGVTYHSFTEYPLNDVEGNPIETDEKLRKNDKYFSFFTGFGYRVAF